LPRTVQIIFNLAMTCTPRAVILWRHLPQLSGRVKC